jgi:hypothetical protein
MDDVAAEIHILVNEMLYSPDASMEIHMASVQCLYEMLVSVSLFDNQPGTPRTTEIVMEVGSRMDAVGGADLLENMHVALWKSSSLYG